MAVVRIKRTTRASSNDMPLAGPSGWRRSKARDELNLDRLWVSERQSPTYSGGIANIQLILTPGVGFRLIQILAYPEVKR